GRIPTGSTIFGSSRWVVRVSVCRGRTPSVAATATSTTWWSGSPWGAESAGPLPLPHRPPRPSRAGTGDSFLVPQPRGVVPHRRGPNAAPLDTAGPLRTDGRLPRRGGEFHWPSN